MRATVFKGMLPKLRPEKLPPGFASYAKNCLLHSGAITPIKGIKAVSNVVDVLGKSLSFEPESLHEIDSLVVGFDYKTNLAVDPIAAFGEHTRIFVDSGKLYRTSPCRIQRHASPEEIFISPPTEPPKLDVLEGVCGDAEEGDCPAELTPIVVSFCYTFVTYLGEESAPSPYAEPVLLSSGDGLLITPVTTPPDNAESIRIYISASSKESAEMLFLTSLDVKTQTSYIYCPDSEEGEEALISDDWQLPPTCIEGVFNVGVASLVAWKGKSLYMSVPNQPHAWLEEFKVTIDHNIVDSFAYTNPAGVHEAYLLTDGPPYHVTLASGDKPLTVRKLPRHLPCIDRFAATFVDDNLYYLSTNGIVLISSGNAAVITANWWDTIRLKRLPGKIRLAVFDRRLLIFPVDTQQEGFMFALPEQDTPYTPTDLVHISHNASAVLQRASGEVLISNSTGVWSWEQSGQPMLAEWRRISNTTPGLTHYTAGKVLNDCVPVRRDAKIYRDMLRAELGRVAHKADAVAYIKKHPEAAEYINEIYQPTTKLLVYKDKVFFYARFVDGMNVFRLPRKGRSSEWGYGVETTSEVYEIHIAQSINDMIYNQED